MYRAMILAIAGLLGGVLAFMIREPSVPRLASDWGPWETVTGLVLGLMIGLLLGGVSGYFQGSRTHVMKGLALGAVIGAAAGAIGISFGSAIFAVTQIRFLGWAVMGGLIGLAEGAIGMSWKRAYYGLIGGVLGGALGGFLFDTVGTLLGPTLVSMQRMESGEVGTIPRAVGFSVLGFGIGLLIGVVEALARKAWVRLILGRNEGKDWSLDAIETFFGRAENAHVPLRGDQNVAPFHACIRREGPRYTLYDMQTPIGIAVNGYPTRQAFLENGDTFQIGTHTLQFFIKGAGRPVHTPQVQHVQFPQAAVTPHGQTVGAAPMGMTVAVPPATSTYTLVAMTGPLAGQRFPLTGSIEMGREGGAIPLSFDAQVSRRHARLEATPAGIQVSDLGSTNGTLVNGVKVPTGVARPGETLTIGHTTFRIE